MSDLLDFSPPGQVTFTLAGAKARFFNAGTTTPRTVYADEAETIPHPVPLLADSNGRFPQAFVSGAAVKVVVTQADDSTGYTLDPCEKVSATGSSASSISFTPSVARPQTNVQDAIDLATFPARTITEGAGIVVTNGNGASGNPTIAFNRGAPVTKTADFTVAATENFLINNKSGSACVVTLPAAASFTGREIMIQNSQSQAVTSASANVIPQLGGAAGTAILPAVAGAWAKLVSNGTNWQITQSGVDLNVTGSAPLFACRAWVNFNGQGTVAIRASGNVSSITDNGLGDYTINFTTAMPDANYAFIGQCSNANNNAAGVTETVQIHQNEAPTASSIRIRTAAVTPSSAALADELFIFAAIFR